MTQVRNKVRRVPRAAWITLGVALVVVVLAACAPDNQQDSLNPKGPYAEKIDTLFQPVFWIAVGVFVLVEGGILAISIKYRHRKNAAAKLPPQVHGNTRLEIGWTILPALVLAVIAVPTVTTIFELAREPADPNTINVSVYGHQWWWEFDYTDPDIAFSDTVSLKTANDLVIPVDTPVYLTLQSEGGLISGDNPDYEVIHSFWVPELAGKQDVIPSRENHVTIQADEPGVYKGQCLEFCGLSHANMRLQVIAMTQEDFDRWVADQRADAVDPATGSPEEQGQQLFDGGLGEQSGGQCIACHTIQGVNSEAGEAASNVAPNLTHFASRDCFAGCMFSRDGDPEAYRADLEEWLRNPLEAKPGSKMPDYNLSEDEIDALTDYLLSLE
ncbi:MAG: cytochrome c oxidase subunit II [Actinomycetota bacterium]